MYTSIETADNLPAHILVVDNCTFQSGVAESAGVGIYLTHTTKQVAKSSNSFHQNPVILNSNS